MKTPRTNTPSAAGGDAGAAKTGAVARQDAASGATQGAATPAAPTSPLPEDPAFAPPDEAGADVAAAETATLADGRPEDVARAGDAAAGSALDAPSVGSGPVGEQSYREAGDPMNVGRIHVGNPAALGASGVAVEAAQAGGAEPGLYSPLGAHGSAPELSRFGPRHGETRRAILAADLAEAPYTGAKLAVPRPAEREALIDYFEAGFDLSVTSRQRGFRRAGVVHPTEPTLRRSEDFTSAEIEAMSLDPMLIVEAIS